MKNPWRFLLAPVAILSCSVLSAAPPMRILPMGDSITEGSAASNYRTTLRTILTAAGYEVDYVGTYTANPGNLTDKEHEGHSGWRIDQLDSGVTGWFSAIEDPDFILLHIGTNDFGQGFNTTTAIDRWDALILKMATLRPHANIVVTNIMQRSGAVDTQIQTQFNAFVQARANAHIAAGRKVTFLDMRAAVPLSDMPDGLHPNQTGSDKMANAWLGAIQSLSTPEGDFSNPALSHVRGKISRTEVDVVFSKPVADSAAALANFSINDGLTISSATLDPTKRVVTLGTSEQVPGTTYTLTVNNVVDRQAVPEAIAPGSSMTFVPALPRGYRIHIAESEQYSLACSLDIPNNPSYRQAQPVYQIDNRASVGAFDRVAYYLELQSLDGGLLYAWASMDAFTQDVAKLAVPTIASGAVFQQGVTNLNVVSNVPGLATGSDLSGNIEFWPGNYEQNNSASVPGASSAHYDFGDQPTPGDYGSMQVHNTGAAQTVFAFNNWGSDVTTKTADIGIGTDPAPVNDGRDYTFHNNAGAYTVKTLQVLVRTSNDHIAPTLSSAFASGGRTQVVANFSEPLATASVEAGGFTLSHGVSVLSAKLSPDRRTVTLVTSLQPAATPLTLTVSGVRDSSSNANPIAPGSNAVVSADSRPSAVIANVGAASSGYQLLYSADLPTVSNFVAANPYRFDDRLADGTYSRVAYYLELEQADQPPRYVWAAMDAFTGGRGHLGIPTFASGAVYQQNVSNLQVVSNVSGVVNGSTVAGGNIEFWPHSYNATNTIAIPNASGSTYDTGDNRSTGATNNVFGSMQIHNHDAAANQTVLALNHFGNDGNVLDIGIGNQGANSPDWTFAANAGNYTKRTLHVLTLPGVATPQAIIDRVPESAGYQLAYSLNIPAAGNLQSGNGFAAYQMNGGSGLGPFSRVAYYMELRKTGDSAPSYVWTSMDAFTKNGAQIGVPTGWMFQQAVTNLNVVSNVPGVVNGSNLGTGNIEFWPSSYNEGNAAGVPNASPSAFDFGDGGAGVSQGYGSMQVHNHGVSQTIFALNNWGAANNTANVPCVGIGSQGTGSPDWTFANNAGTWNVTRLLQVYVLPAYNDQVPPTLAGLRASTEGNAVRLSFSEPISESAAAAAVIEIPGLGVTGVEVQGTNDLIVRTSAQTSGVTYTVNVSGVADRSPAANTVPLSSTFTGYAPPASFANIAEISGYRHVLSLSLPGTQPRYNVNGVNYDLDQRKFEDMAFDRVAYLMELNGDWAYASFDKHLPFLSQIGVPTPDVSAVPVQQLVTRLNVASNVAGVVTGTDLATGNIEFWSGNYEASNDRGIPGASATLFDFGDRMTGGGHGSMQIHNHGASQTVMAFNSWGNNGNLPEMGIGNHPAPVNNGLDWTFAQNAGSFATKRLHVLVREAEPGGPAAQFHAEPGTKVADAGETATFTVNVAGVGPFTYQWRHNGVAIEGANKPWLDLADINGTDSGIYDVVVTGPGMVATTSPAGTLIVTGVALLPTEIEIEAGEGGSVILTFYGDPGRTYEIQRSLALGAWQALDTKTAAHNGEMPFVDDDAPEDRAFYRAVPLP